ncbi:MAG: 3-oxoacyl-[acyl-carrier-protein] reductase [Planctomycetota bacterium]
MSESRVAFVTGASRGIGRAIAKRLASDGKLVVLASRSEGPLNDLKHEIEESGGNAVVCAVDVGDGAALAKAIETTAEEQGRLDILVNNAGITRDNLILRMSDEEFDEVMRVNTRSAFVACRAAARPMMRGRFGRIINIASTSGLVGNSGQANYAASKAALTGLTKTIARELGTKGITANVVAPGFVKTDMTANLPETVIDSVKKMIATKDVGEPEDIAALVAFLASDESGYVTGQTIAADGGMTMC